MWFKFLGYAFTSIDSNFKPFVLSDLLQFFALTHFSRETIQNVHSTLPQQGSKVQLVFWAQSEQKIRYMELAFEQIEKK